MINLKMFSTEEDLLKLTGLKDHDDLWDAGFDLDDWDVGFCADAPLDYDDDDSHWLMTQMENYCAGYEHTVYNDKDYYMVYHS